MVKNHPKSALGSIGPVLISLSQVRDGHTTNSSHFQGTFTNTQNVGPVGRIQSTIFPRKSTTGYLGKVCVVSEKQVPTPNIAMTSLERAKRMRSLF